MKYNRILSVIIILVLSLLSFSILTFPALAEGEVIIITTEAELYQMEQNRYASYILGQDINLAEEHDVMFPNEQSAFMGKFDGNGYSLIRLNIISENSVAGFIGYSYGEVLNLRVISAKINISGTPTAVGGIVGMNFGKVTNCEFDGVFYKNGTKTEEYGAVGTNTISFVNNNESIVSENSVSSEDNSLAINNEYIKDGKNTKNNTDANSKSTSGKNNSKSAKSGYKQQTASKEAIDNNDNSSVNSSGDFVVYSDETKKSNKRNSYIWVILCSLALGFLICYKLAIDYIIPNVLLKTQNIDVNSEKDFTKAKVKSSNLENAQRNDK